MALIYPYCICTTVSAKALQSLLESSGEGSYRTSDPFLVAREYFELARAEDRELAILFAAGDPLEFSHWGLVRRLEVVELHRATYETDCAFSRLQPVNPIWHPIDSVFLKPSEDQLRRESLEGIHQHRYALSIGEIHQPWGLHHDDQDHLQLV